MGRCAGRAGAECWAGLCMYGGDRLALLTQWLGWADGL